MGNKSTTDNTRAKDIDQTKDVIQYSDYAQGVGEENIGEDYYDYADDIYERIRSKPDADIYVERYTEIFIDPIKGTAYPYESPRNIGSETSDRRITTISSENPKYIELIICQSDMNELVKEKFAVNRDIPDHECKGNCECIGKLIKINRSNGKTTLHPLTLSPTSSEPGKKISSKETCPPMKGGADKVLTTDSSDDEDEGEKNDMFSETSELVVEPNKNKNKNKKNQNKKNNNGDNDDLGIDDVDNDDAENIISDDDIEDEPDDDDEDLEGIEDEDITEDGLLFDQSDITSSDLYRIQSRVFGSETDTEDNLESDIGFTEKVEAAMNQANRRKKMFDSEDRDILNMNSPTDRYLRKPFRKNNKYH